METGTKVTGTRDVGDSGGWTAGSQQAASTWYHGHLSPRSTSWRLQDSAWTAVCGVHLMVTALITSHQQSWSVSARLVLRRVTAGDLLRVCHLGM